ncbi:hypothetical protein [Mangrovibacterium marinum]|uniref:NHL repeat-containing protein n=1 Tax=Mangrovibacterium marinum TaxID=1639118 RepID=A0A2T5C0W7_9BACT|nr:hypothetical protein [Mangrovibacterium marinum]PTN08228.1 hypothetical protein C8N47_110114 [Mangrovibacterium marinum]
MGKTIKLIINILIFIVVIGFIGYMVSSVNKDEKSPATTVVQEAFVSPMEKVKTFDFPFEIEHFVLSEKQIFLTDSQTVYVYRANGETLNSFPIKSGMRDIEVADDKLYVLYPTFIDVYSTNGDSVNHWEACSDRSDYCAMALTNDFVFVTDAQNKNICKYTREGNFVKFIASPHNFIIPSYSFDIFNHNDTIYAVNSGRHLIESYTTDGDFIASFGGSGTESGFFAGCCNPAHIQIDRNGQFFTSEKGNPRISTFKKNGQFDQVLLNNQLLGGGYDAYEIGIDANRLFVAGKNHIDIYAFKN